MPRSRASKSNAWRSANRTPWRTRAWGDCSHLDPLDDFPLIELPALAIVIDGAEPTAHGAAAVTVLCGFHPAAGHGIQIFGLALHIVEEVALLDEAIAEHRVDYGPPGHSG